ncbi:MAG: hypothetical protein WA081_00250 [Desulfosalsimonadaceae bacterium]
MRDCRRFTVFCVVLCLSVCMVSCEKKKQEGKVVVSAQEFVLRQDKENSYIIDAKGKIKNVGEVDVKNVVVTGECRSCSEIWAIGIWTISGTEKWPYQKDTISYLPAGKEAEFQFKSVADFASRPGEPPPNKPDQLGVVVESFETVDK